MTFHPNSTATVHKTPNLNCQNTVTSYLHILIKFNTNISTKLKTEILQNHIGHFRPATSFQDKNYLFLKTLNYKI